MNSISLQFVNVNMKRLTLMAVLLGSVLTLLLMAQPGMAQDNLTISIPALNVSSSIREFPLNGISWTIGAWEKGIGHLQGTSWFNENSNIALAGHSIMPDQKPGIFYQLHLLNQGDEITISINGSPKTYRVSNVTTVSIDDLSVLAPTGSERLTLITCDAGSYDPESQYYQRRIIVTADPA